MPNKKHLRSKFSIIIKTMLPVGISVLLTALAFYGFILPHIQHVLMAEKQDQLRNLTQNVVELAGHYSQRVVSGELSLEESQSRLLERIRAMRYGMDGKEYFWVHDMNYHMLMHPYMTELEGTDMKDYEDPQGNRMVYEMVETVRKAESGFVEYMWPLRDEPDQIEAKLSYVQRFEPWGWVIGTGIYYNDIQQSIGLITNQTNKVLTAIFITIVFLSIYLLFRDIRNEERRAQVECERLTLINNLRETNLELEDITTRLESASRAKDLFLANVSHDLRTPLNGILGFSKLIEEAESSKRQQLFDEYVMYINKSGRYLLNMINDILDLSKMEAGKVECHPMVFNLYHLMTDVIQSLTYFGMEKNIGLSLECEPADMESLYVEADQTLLNKALYNLLSNAIKYTPDGQKVGMRLDETDENILIQVWDQGIGIPKESQKKVFEPFFQLNSRKGSGTGLGLSIARDIVQLHSGSITLTSHENEGTTFTIALPSTIKREPVMAEQPHETAAFDFSGKSALVVEDDPISRKFMTLYLKKHGFRTQGIDSGKNAIQIVQNQTFDVILLDIQLPDINGKELLPLLLKTLQKKPFITALTAYSGDTTKNEIMNAGFDHVFSKPVDTQALLTTLENALM